jgi:hypothetical protein
MRAQHLILTAALLSMGGCGGPTACDEEHLPEHGRTQTSEELFRFAQYAAKKECWSELYDHLSKRTRDEHSYIKLRPFITSWKTEEPWEYRIVDVLSKGEFVEVFPDGPQGQELILVSYQEAGKPELLAQLLVVREVDEGKPVRRLGLQEQYEGKVPISQAPADEDE